MEQDKTRLNMQHEELLNSFGQLVRMLSRVRNTHPGIISANDSKQIDHAMAVMAKSADKNQAILAHQVATGQPASNSLEGCMFHYCDKSPVCVGKCRYNKL